MNENLTNDFEVRLATLEAMGVDATGYSTIFEVDKAILEATLEGGGGGGEGVTPAQVRTIVEGYDYVTNSSLSEKGYAKDASLGDYYQKANNISIGAMGITPTINLSGASGISTYILPLVTTYNNGLYKTTKIGGQYLTISDTTTASNKLSISITAGSIKYKVKDANNVETVETFVTDAYVDEKIGDINTALEAIIGA